MISRVQREALATLVDRLRDDWERPGILAAIDKASDLGSPAAIAAALCRLAENHELRTPALLAERGPHWGGTTVATRKPPTMCPDHPTCRAFDCERCEREAADREAAQAKIRELRDELKRRS